MEQLTSNTVHLFIQKDQKQPLFLHSCIVGSDIPGGGGGLICTWIGVLMFANINETNFHWTFLPKKQRKGLLLAVCIKGHPTG